MELDLIHGVNPMVGGGILTMLNTPNSEICRGF